MTWPEFDSYRAEATGGPTQQHIDADERGVILSKCLAQFSPEDAESAYVFPHIFSDGSAERQARNARRDSPQESVLLGFRGAVNYVKCFIEACEELRDFFGWMLQVVIH